MNIDNLSKFNAAGFTEQQAETLKEILGTELTKKKDLAETKVEIIKWVAGMLVAQAAIVATLVKLL